MTRVVPTRPLRIRNAGAPSGAGWRSNDCFPSRRRGLVRPAGGYARFSTHARSSRSSMRARAPRILQSRRPDATAPPPFLARERPTLIRAPCARPRRCGPAAGEG